MHCVSPTEDLYWQLLHLLSCLFPPCFLTKSSYQLLISLMRAACPVYHMFLDLITLIIFDESALLNDVYHRSVTQWVDYSASGSISEWICHSINWSVSRSINHLVCRSFTALVSVHLPEVRPSKQPENIRLSRQTDDIKCGPICIDRSCGDCPHNASDCFRKFCVTADGFQRGLLTANRQLPGPVIQVSRPCYEWWKQETVLYCIRVVQGCSHTVVVPYK
jgi:hypothetical protein